MQDRNYQQAAIRLGTHGENYGSWMSNPVFYVVGGLFALAVVLAVLSFAVFHITAAGCGVRDCRSDPACAVPVVRLDTASICLWGQAV